jgi:hypothetical protein
MNEAVRPRFAVDLDEIERQLAEAQPAAQPAPVNRNDPLAELARIVGQDDPFHSLLAPSKAHRPLQNPPDADDLFVSGIGSKHGSARDQQHDLRATFEGEPGFNEPQGQAIDPYAPYDAQSPQAYDQAYAPTGYEQSSYDDGHQDAVAHGYDSGDEDHDFAPVSPPRSRKRLIAVGAVLGAAVLGLGGAFVASKGHTVLSRGEPPLIKAMNEPTKVQPQSPGGLEVPNQNKQIYERANQDAQTKVVNREEQPIDVRQAARSGAQSGAPATTGGTGSIPAGLAAGPTAQPQPSSAGLNLGEPRRVRTVSIRPDGTVIGDPAAARPAAAPAALPPLSLPPAAQAGGASAPAAMMAAQPPRAVPSGVTPSPAPRAAAPAPTPTPSATTPAPRTSTASTTGGSSPQPAQATPSVQTQPQKVASAQPVAPPVPAPEATAAVGGFAVQLGVTASEPDARTTLQKLQQKYASDLNGQATMIRKAEVNGSTVYRVRVGPLSRDDAASLCSKIQGQGGQCFVAKN